MAKLVRPSQGRMLLGVCAGLADWWNMDRTLLRVLYVLVSVCSAAFPGILCYIVLGILMPPEE
ncbi:MAG: PspC domain-containing protein [Acidobacteriota bacterium]|nr:PspC domain-containing protein [Acidobacteriota bacterium]MDE2660781.1 PspC domain-containing protein [Acidobacteriota bacterium]MDE2712637.1 PspC domain-containing protein [Acidobacteriota bacterium]MDE2883113.1 PspC domain-containing protein [Acidobacteriota bacterium]MDE2971940.1 PspC domain-containing protein [Acidobacteriota bacterium]